MNLTAWCPGKATGFKNDADRVEKNMAMATVSAYGFLVGSDGCKTDPTEYDLFSFLVFLIIRQSITAIVNFICQFYAQMKLTMINCCLAGNGQQWYAPCL